MDYERYIADVAAALTEAGVPVVREWAETDGGRATEDIPEPWEGGIDIIGHVDLAWTEVDGWYAIYDNNNTRGLGLVGIDPPVADVVAAALRHVPVLTDRAAGDLRAGATVYDGDLVLDVVDDPLPLSDGSVIISLADRDDPEETIRRTVDPEDKLKVEV